MVNAGDQVKKGQLLADNNFTQGGVLAIGRNLNPEHAIFCERFRGGNRDFGCCGQKLSSEHLYDLSKALDSRMQVSPDRFTTYAKRHKVDAENWAQPDR